MAGDEVEHPTHHNHKTAERWKIAGVLILILSATIVFLVSRCGLLLTDDSLDYLAAAKSFRETGALLGTDSMPFVAWPPLFPMLLSLLPSPADNMQILNLFLVAIIGWLFWRLIDRQLTDFRFRVACLIGFMCGVQLLLVSVFLWSELLFIVLLLAFTEAMIRASASRVAVALAFVTGALLCLQRNAGLFIVAGAASWLYLIGLPRHKNFGIAIVILASMIPGLWWNASNIWFTTANAVSDVPIAKFLGENLLTLTDGITRSVTPFRIMAIPITATIVILPVTIFWRERHKKSELFLFVAYLCFYITGMSMFYELSTDDVDRYTTVVLPFIMILCFSLGEEFFVHGSKVMRKVLLVGIFVWTLYPVSRMGKNAIQWNRAACVVSSRAQAPGSNGAN